MRAILLLAAAFSQLAQPAAVADDLSISAAVSLKRALEAILPGFEKAKPGVRVAFNFGASGSLGQQIAHGAPVDVFISAAIQPMNELENQGLLLEGSRVTLAGNRLVLIAPAQSKIPTGFAGLASPEIRKIAAGEPRSVPAGIYAREVIDHLGLAPALVGKLIFAKDARQVLTYVEAGHADAGFVYATDAAGLGSVRVVAVAETGWHSPITYPAAIVRSTPRKSRAEEFLRYLRSPAARAVFDSLGFKSKWEG